MIEYDVYEKDSKYKAVRAQGFFCWQALLISLVKVPFSSVIYPFYKGHKTVALIAFILELSALLLLFLVGAAVKPVALLLIFTAVFGLSIGYYVILRKVAEQYYGDFFGKFHGASEEQAISEAIKHSNKLSEKEASAA